MQRARVKRPEGKPTVRQIYALAGELCKRAGEEFPRTRGSASALIARLRGEEAPAETV